MQQRHRDRKRYFDELANTSREFFIGYLRPHITLSEATKVLEIGCGEGGNLLPFAELGCKVTGIDISERRIGEAQAFFSDANRSGTFVCMDFLSAPKPASEAERYDVLLLHDVVEHIENTRKRDFFLCIKQFVKQRGVVFFGFPAWQNPFGGHQQIARGKSSKLPFVHLLPVGLYKGIMRLGGATVQDTDELMSIRRSRITIEQFETLASATGFTVVSRTLWLVNPHYKQKFGLRPRPQWLPFSRLPYLRNYYTTSAFYLLRKG